MATPAVIVVVSVALLSLLALGAVVLLLLQQVKGLTGTIRKMQDELEPALEKLSRDTEVTQHELQRVSESAAQLQADLGSVGAEEHQDQS